MIMRIAPTLAFLTIGFTSASVRAQAEVQPIVAGHILGPHKAAFEAGALLKPSATALWWPTAAAAVGLCGGQFSVGVARPLRYSDFGGPGAEFSIRLQGTVLRTWRSPWYVDGDRTYAGAEITVTVPALVGVRVGLLRRISGGAGSRKPAV